MLQLLGRVFFPAGIENVAGRGFCLASGVLYSIYFPGRTAVLKDLLPPGRDLVLDPLDDILAGFDGFGAVDGGGENKQTDLPCQDSAEAMVDMQAGQWISSKGCFPDLMELKVSHFRIGGVFDGGYRFTIDHIIPDLAQKDAVGSNVLFSAMRCNGLGDKLRGDRAIDEDFLWFLF